MDSVLSKIRGGVHVISWAKCPCHGECAIHRGRICDKVLVPRRERFILLDTTSCGAIPAIEEVLF